jgi:hypothetical protein
MTIVLLLSALVVIDVFRLFRKSAVLSRAGLLLAAVARALIPLSAAIGIGVWLLISSFEGIAASGSGGLATMATGADQMVRTLLAGVIGFAVVLVLALILGVRKRQVQSIASSPRRTAVAALGTIVVLGSLAGTWMAMNWADRVGVGILGPLLRPGIIAPTVVARPIPPVPSSYSKYMSTSGQQAALESERLPTSRAIGFGVCALLIVLSLKTSSVFSGVNTSGASWNLLRGGVAALVAGAVWYSVHLSEGAGWLRTVIDR